MADKNQRRTLDFFLDHYDQKYPTPNGRIIQGICALVASFSILDISWALPFPHIGFLGQYNSYFNWASFVIAISIYYYSTLSPLLSYLMLFLALVFTYLISVIEKQFPDQSRMAIFFMLILLLSLLLHYQHVKRISKHNFVPIDLSFIWIGPIWVLSLLLRRFRIKF